MSLPHQPNQSLIDGLDCLLEIARAEAPVGGRELARRLGLETTRAHRLAKTLAHLGLLEQLPDRRFVSGKGMHVLSALSLRSSGLMRAAAEVLEQAEVPGCSLALGVRWRDQVSYLLFRHPGRRFSESLGAVGAYPARQSAIGRVLSAVPPPRRVLRRRGMPPGHGVLAVPVGLPPVAGLAVSGPLKSADVSAITHQLRQWAADIHLRMQHENET